MAMEGQVVQWKDGRSDGGDRRSYRHGHRHRAQAQAQEDKAFDLLGNHTIREAKLP